MAYTLLGEFTTNNIVEVKSMKRAVLIFGGLGSETSSVVRLYEPLLLKLKEQYYIFAIDPRSSTRMVGDSSFSFPYEDCFSDLSSYLCENSTLDIASVFVLTPVSYHLTILIEFEQHALLSNTLFVIEKPSFSLDEVEESFLTIVPKLKQQGARFYFIETVLVAPSFKYLFEQKLISSSLPNKIVAIAKDNPINTIACLSDYRFENRIKLLNERGLLNVELSGGAGYGFDMGIHAVAGLVRWLQLAGFAHANIQIMDVSLFAEDFAELDRSIGAETHLYVSGQISVNRQSCDLYIEAGKAGAFWDRRIELHYYDYVVVVGFGTLSHPPYVCILSDEDEQLVSFDVSAAGYSMHFNDILHMLDYEVDVILDSELNQRLMEQSMKLLKSIFDFVGPNPQQREKYIQYTGKHADYLLTEMDRKVNEKMHRILNRFVQG